MFCAVFSFFVSLLVAASAFAEPLEDNSFLVEEAYNQEAGVVQFIQSYQKQTRNKNWNYVFVNEIPMGGQSSQFSYEIPVSYLETSGKTQIKDLKLNYRRELVRTDSVVATVRTSLLTSTGDYKNGFGSGATGYEAAVLSSIKITPKWAQHWNVGGSITPNAKNANGDSADPAKYFWALSNVYFLNDAFNVMLEMTGTLSEEVVGDKQKLWGNESVISPSLRYAIDYKEWQFVPGLAFPIEFGTNAGQNQTLVYLSIEGKMF